MAELNTIITLRQGTTAEWNNSSVVLKQGEMGLEYLENGSVKIKAGDGEHLWSALSYIGSDVKATNVFQVELGANDLDDIAAIEAQVAQENAKKQDGDIAIVKATIADGKYSYTWDIQTPTTCFFTSEEGASNSYMFNMIVGTWEYKNSYTDINELFACWHESTTDLAKAEERRETLWLNYQGTK